MEFIDNNSINRLNFRNLLSKVEVISPYGKEKLKNIRIFKQGEEKELEDEFLQMEKILTFISSEKKRTIDILIALHKLKDIKMLIKNLSEDIVLDIVDLFEIKAQALLFQEMNIYLKENNEVFKKFILEDMNELIEALDPDNERVATFRIYESYSLILKEIRRQKKEVEKKLFIEKDIDKLKALKDERLSILLDEEREEFKIRKNLSKFLKNYTQAFLSNIDKLSSLDLILAKVKFAQEYAGKRPVVIREKKEIVLKQAVNIEVKEFLESVGKKYTPIDINLASGITVITGANMGGKSVALKTIAENVLLFHMGFFTFCKEAQMSLLDFLFFVSDDMQDISKGLSTFGAEIIKLKEVNKYLNTGIGLIIFDEFARGTNPKEGQKFVRALAKYLNGKDSISIITTHFDSVITREMKHYQVVGLKKLNFEELKNKMAANNNSMELIQENMDFSLEESESTEVPKDAYNIAKLIGLDDEISEMIYREYTEEEIT
ncbi:MAG: hypothetical protein IJG31_07155 [Fusobacterium sp.]|nr:hypothetical protein [Fusobacterium sp.]